MTESHVNTSVLTYAGKFRIPNTIYGRDEEIATIHHEINDVFSKKKKHSAVFLSGVSGIGKTQLVKEVRTLSDKTPHSIRR